MTPMEIALVVLLAVVSTLWLRERGRKSLQTLEYVEMTLAADARRLAAEKALQSLLRGLERAGIPVSVQGDKVHLGVDDPGWKN